MRTASAKATPIECDLTARARSPPFLLRRSPLLGVLTAAPCCYLDGTPQAVHELYEITPGSAWKDGEDAASRIVVIGRSLDRGALQAAFAGCAVRK
mmetsp:Transcript_32365/g.81067  ORF Transcript_32365/g.81067 Transcript_32365/m.81067 type:complete len:96 (+) Transcript_32365:333-620(+)